MSFNCSGVVYVYYGLSSKARNKYQLYIPEIWNMTNKYAAPKLYLKRNILFSVKPFRESYKNIRSSILICRNISQPISLKIQ
jgi:hypothetical protein